MKIIRDTQVFKKSELYPKRDRYSRKSIKSQQDRG